MEIDRGPDNGLRDLIVIHNSSVHGDREVKGGQRRLKHRDTVDTESVVGRKEFVRCKHLTPL